MIYDELSNKYLYKKEITQNIFEQTRLFYVKEYGEYISIHLNIKSFSKFEFKGVILMLILDGSGIVRVDQRIIPVTFGDLLIFNGDSSHIISNDLWRVCYMVLDGENIYKLISSIFNGKNLYHISKIDYIYGLFRQIYRTMDSNMCSYLDSCGYLLHLFSEIIKYDTKEELTDYFEPRILNYIENHYMIDISVEDMAEYCGYSPSSFIRKFKKIFGETPHEYLNFKRITYAKELLAIGELPIKDIAEVVGYNSFSNFCVAFKNKENMTPKQYQNIKRR